MPAATFDIIIEQGATFLMNITWKQSAGGTPVDLTGYTARMQVRKSYNEPDPPALSLTTENGGIALGGAAGTIAITGSATLTDAMEARPHVYDLELVSGSVVTRVVQGKAFVRPQVTK